MTEQIQAIDEKLDQMDTQIETDRRRMNELQHFKLRELQAEAVLLQDDIALLKISIDKERTLLL